MSKKRILFLTPYPFDQAPSQRLKFEQYYSYFKQDGFELDHRAFISQRFWKIIYKKGFALQKFFYTVGGYFRRLAGLFTVRKYDVVYIHLWVTPFGFPFFEWLYTKLAKKVIYDIDDLIYLHNKNQYNRFIAAIKGKNKPIFLMKAADHVITCTPYLDSFVRKYNSNTTDISSTVNTDTYIPVNPYTNTKPIVLGWSGSHSTSKYFLLLASALKQLANNHQFKILLMGDPSVQIPGLDIEAIQWSSESEIRNLQKMDIGLYPLPDEEWVYGKSGLKAIQYMALGIPTVATAIGTNFRVIQDGVSGFLVKSDSEWVEKLGLLINDAVLRKRIGDAARKAVEEKFSIRANAAVYLSIVNDLISPRLKS